MPLLKEFQDILLENIVDFPSFHTPREALDWFQSRYPKISCGSYRCVYDLGDGKAVKVAKTNEAVGQNAEEVEFFQCLGDYAPAVFERDPDFFWVVVEKVRKISEQDFKNTLVQEFGLPERIIRYGLEEWLMGALKGSVHPLIQNDLNTLMDNPWFRSLVLKLQFCDLSAEDLAPKNWGVTTSGNLVIVDATGKLSDSNW